MKGKLFVVCSLLSTLAFAADPPTYEVSCGVKKQPTQGGYKISASVKGLVTGRSGKTFNLDNYTVGYTVFSDDEVWGEETITGKDLNNDANYKPRKYKGHVRFTLPSKQGKVELIYPEKLGREGRFKAHIVLTYINDHFGGTADVYCTRKKID